MGGERFLAGEVRAFAKRVRDAGDVAGGAIGELFELAKITNKFCDDADLENKGKSDAAAVAKFTSLLTTLKELSNILGIFMTAPAAPSGPAVAQL